jgi:putative transposase
VTFCTKNRIDYFGEIEDGEMVLNDYGKIVNENIRDIQIHFSDADVDEYVVMPNHITML